MHPELATLVAFQDGELDPAQARRIQQHLEHCAECRLRAELGQARLDGTANNQEYSPSAVDADGRRAELLARVRSLRASQGAVTPSLLALLIGRKAASAVADAPANGRRWKPPTVAILAATALHLLLGLACWSAWRITGNPTWARTFIGSAGDLFLLELSAVALYLNVLVLKGFEQDEPLQRGWFLITASSTCSVAGLIFSKLLARNAAQVWPSLNTEQLYQFGLFLDGPLHLALLLCAFYSILRVFHRAGIVSVRFSPGGLALIACIAAYTLCESVQVVFAFASGKLSTLQDLLKSTNDPLLLALLIAVLLLRRSVRNLGSEFVRKSWTAFLCAIYLVLLGDMTEWAASYGYVDSHISSLVWFIWFFAGASYAIAAAFQLEAMGRSAECFAVRKRHHFPSVTL